jgi:cystathionine gamma-lyase
MSEYRLRTRAIHAGQPNDPTTGAVAFPIYQTSTFAQIEPGLHHGFSYARTDHPTRRALEENLAALENGRHGLAYASGMAAINGVLTLLRAGDRVVSSRDLYGGAWRIFTKLYAKFGVRFDFIDTTDLSAVAAALRKPARILWLETPSNPLLRVTDIAACSALARKAGAMTVVDNTFATPILQQPLALGADVVLHSTTKYINGHSDVLGGALITDDDDLHAELKFFQNAVGAVPGPQDCFLILRGIKTLPLRMAAHCASAREILLKIIAHPLIRQAWYPGLDTPGAAIVRKQMSDGGAMVSIELDADAASTVAFTKSLRLWTLAESLGGVKSLLCHPATMTHASVEPEVRCSVGISDGLIRLSVGLEDPEDLIEDLLQALDAVPSAVSQRLEVAR